MPVLYQLFAGTASTLAATFVGVWILRSRGASWRSLGLITRSFGSDAKLALAALALVLAPLLTLSSGLDQLVPYRHPIIDFLSEHRDPLSLAMVFVSAVVVAPIAEEFFFRGVLQGWLQKRLPELGGLGAIAIASLAFGLAHVGQGLAWIPLVFFGMAVGYLAKQTGSIVPGIIVHSLFNAVSVVLVLLQTHETRVEIDLVGGACFRHNPATLQCHVAEPRSASQERLHCRVHSFSSAKTESPMGRCG
jgi:membrane protease YdiL (CAAX protease family)